MNEEAKGIAWGVLFVEQWLSCVYDDETGECTDGLDMFQLKRADELRVVGQIAHLLDDWVDANLDALRRDSELKFSDCIDLGEDLQLIRYGSDYEERYPGTAVDYESFPEIDMDFWFEGDLLRVELL